MKNDSSLRLLVEPVEVTRDGIKLTVENGACDDQHCIIVYQADGLSLQAANSQGEGAITGGIAVIRLPDGSILTQTGGELSGWGTGYRQRVSFSTASSKSTQYHPDDFPFGDDACRCGT